MKKIWTEQELEYLREHYPNELTRTIAKKLNRTYSSVSAKAYTEGIYKSDEFKLSEKSGRLTGTQGGKTRFKKGQTPWNKGRKMSPELYDKCRRTMFKPGAKPHNTREDGDISIRDGYQIIRVAEGEWIELHRYIWIKNNGPIPKGYNVVFRDGNRKNCTLENLELISNSQLMLRNTIHRYPAELVGTMRVIGKLTKTINQNEKHRNNTN